MQVSVNRSLVVLVSAPMGCGIKITLEPRPPGQGIAARCRTRSRRFSNTTPTRAGVGRPSRPPKGDLT